MAKEITIPAEASYHVKNLIINGVPKRVIGKPDVSLLTVLRDQLKMTGTKRGCDCGQCGVCQRNTQRQGRPLLHHALEERARVLADPPQSKE